jgi:hypothetical protein
LQNIQTGRVPVIADIKELEVIPIRIEDVLMA